MEDVDTQGDPTPARDWMARDKGRGESASRAREVQRLKALDQRIVEIAAWLAPSTLLNPTMASRRRAWELFRQAWRRGSIIDPHFDYLPLPIADIDRSRAALDALEFGDTLLDELLEDQRDQLHLQLDLLLSRGTGRFGEVATDIHGLPDAELRDLAYGILDGTVTFPELPDQPRSQKGERLNAWRMAEEMRRALHEMGIEGWRVTVLGEMSARMSVSARHQEVRVKSDSLFTPQDRDRLIVHELGTHVRRAHNGFSTGLMNLGLGLSGYMATEEGLASHMEQKHGMLRRSMTQIYAYRALGAHFAVTRGFADTFCSMLEVGATPEVAWDVTLRIKRGLTDTSLPGGNPKDYVYLHGHHIVTQYLRDGGDEDALFIGKVAIEHIPLIQDILARWDFSAAT